jgi:hypothetical protein
MNGGTVDTVHFTDTRVVCKTGVAINNLLVVVRLIIIIIIIITIIAPSKTNRVRRRPAVAGELRGRWRRRRRPHMIYADGPVIYEDAPDNTWKRVR